MFDIKAHLNRLDSQLSAAGLSQAAKWITEHTYLGGRKFSFKDHEFQLRVAEEQAQVINVRKCSQVGLSELSTRLALSYSNLVPGFTTIYTLPTVTFARGYSSMRIDPIIAGSPTLQQATNSAVNNAEIKGFSEGFLIVKGTMGATQAISIPADCVISDEYDFSTIDTITQYQSRLTHSPYKLKRNFSTPTVEGYGISAEFAESQQWWLQAKCTCCGHWFIPNYYEHVRIPGFSGDLRQIKKSNIDKYSVDDAYVACPKCGGKPDLTMPNREWTCVANEGRAAVGIQIQPFDAPKIITPGYLVRASVEYARQADFVNFNLGLPSSDSESAFAKEEVEGFFRSGVSWNFPAHFMGADFGRDCHIMIGATTPDGELRIVHAEVVGLRDFERRKMELKRQYRVVGSVFDLYPYTETIWRMQAKDPNLWASQFVEKNTIQAFEVKHTQADIETAQPEVRELHVNRNRALDALLELARQPDGLLFKDMPEKENIVTQLIDLKRLKDFSNGRNGAEAQKFIWRKSNKKIDHYHHTLLYVWLATQLRGTISSGLTISPILGKFRSKTEV